MLGGIVRYDTVWHFVIVMHYILYFSSFLIYPARINARDVRIFFQIAIGFG